MTPFLQAVARDLYERFGDDQSRVAVIFPGKRAGLWMDRYLYECAGHPIWSPSYLSVDELFASQSSLSKESSIRTICLLHEIFCSLTKSTEPLDDFYFWGELMLSDFDDIDKNLVEASRLFVNLADIKDLESQFDYLSDEQKALLSQFFSGLHNTAERTELKQRFIGLWQVMGDIYAKLRTTLHSQGLAYEGMMYRDAIEHFDPSKLTYESYVIVGFNVLNKVEQQLFTHLKDSGKALFYWDYDNYYKDNAQHEAGTFVRENIARYGNTLTDESLYDNLRHLPEIHYISASTDNAQARYLHTWLTDNITKQEQDTAVVLCNEDIAHPVLHALPSEKVKNVNITMGFKLTQTAPYTLVNAYLNLHTKGYDDTQHMYALAMLTTLLSHPYILQLYPEARQLQRDWLQSKRIYIAPSEYSIRDPKLQALLTRPTDNTQLLATLSALISDAGRLFVSSDEKDHLAQLSKEALFQLHRTISSFKSLTEEGILKIGTKTLVRLMLRMLTQISIPFHGEPAIGLQVMGVLETRNLDFRHLILLSTNEGKLPRSSSESSFIPHNLREAFGMNTIQRQNAVYAYYFYRMIQRAERVTIVYNNGTDGLNKQEPSRYIMQLQVEFPGKLTPWELHSPSVSLQHEAPVIEQTAETRRKLQKHFGCGNDKYAHRLSPSALNDYLDCRLKFYLAHVEGFNPPEEVDTDINTATLGTIFHKSAELAYEKLTQRNDIIRGTDIKALLDDKPLIEHYVDTAFRTEFFHITPDAPLHYNGTQLIVRSVIINYLTKLLRIDHNRTPFRYIASEKKVEKRYTINSHGTPVEVRLGGIIDRIDSKQGTDGREVTRIIDYKTGGTLKKISGIKSVEELFTRSGDKDYGKVFQTFYYAYLMCGEYDRTAPSLLFVRETADEHFEPYIEMNKKPVSDFSDYYDEFGEQLHALIEEIFNSDVPYTAATTDSACKYCKFLSLCGKKEEKNDY